MTGPDFDVIVAGAGMVGATLALILAEHGFRVAVVEQHTGPRWRQDHHDPRVNALHLGTERLLGDLGVWSGVAARRVSPFRRIRVWDDRGRVTFDGRDHGCPHLGHIVETSAVGDELHERLTRHPNVEWVAPAAIDTLSWSSREIVAGSGRRHLSARLLAGADGARSRVARLCDIAFRWRPYRARAIVARVAGERPHLETARQRFLASGPLALLPLSDGSCSIVWSCRDVLADELLALDGDEFGRRLTEASQGVLGPLRLLDHRSSFELQHRHADRYVATRVALLGDAAHVIHPLAGLGANLGFADAAALAGAVCAARDRDRDIGSARVLSGYERGRRFQNELVQRGMDLFDRTFAARDPVSRMVRGAGLNLTDRLLPVKEYFIRYATGLHHDWSRLPRDAEESVPFALH
jgi:2-octaprenylphenol hydroxylase